MIQLSTPSIINNNGQATQKAKTNKQNIAFGGVVDVATQALYFCDKYPMLNVSAIDAVTAIIPRTAFDAQTNGFAAFETFRRESSGLIVNCLLPSFIVLGLGKILNNTILKDAKNLKMGSVWANQHSIETLSEYYKKAKGETTEQRVKNFVSDVVNDISCVDAKEEVHYRNHDLNKSIDAISQAIIDDSVSVKRTVKTAYTDIVAKTRAAEILKLNGESFGSNLTSLIDNTIELGRRFKLEKEGKDFSKFNDKAIRLVNAKSLAGFAVIMPLAMSMQSINRWITKKTSGKEGAPIYKDYARSHKVERDKENLAFKKVLAVGTMLGIAVASMAKMPTMGMFQFKGLFPTMDQCRWISTSTFCSRMAVAEDNNELRETFIRDSITFASLYWLGDYASKLTAKAFEKINPNLKLLNHSRILPSDAGCLKKVGNWIKNTHLKSFDEVTHNAKNARTISQLAGFGFSTLVLGLLLPKYTRMQTEKKEREFREKQIQQNTENIKKIFRLDKNKMPGVFQKFSGLQN